MAVTTPLLAVRDLAYGYPAREIGRDVSLSLEAGEVLALLGPNGSGKTTLFRTILGLLPAIAGRIEVEARDIQGWGPGGRARVFGYVPQASPGYFPYTVMEMVLMGRTARLGAFAAPGKADRAAAAEALADLGITHLGLRDFTRISGGERQLALVARALAQEPRILVLDEPTASLDFGNQRIVLDTVRGLGRRGLGIILSTHHPDEAFACASHAALLKDGRLVAAGPADDILTSAALTRLYGVEIVVADVGGQRICLSRSSRPAD